MRAGWLRQWQCIYRIKQTLEPTQRICALMGGEFRRLFQGLLDMLGAGEIGFKPYSLRRGGATHDFARTLAMDRLLVRLATAAFIAE